MIAGILLGVVVVLSAGAGLAAFLLTPASPQTAASEEPPHAVVAPAEPVRPAPVPAAPAATPSPKKEEPPTAPADPPMPPPAPVPEPAQAPKPPMPMPMPPMAKLTDEEIAVNRAIDRGVAALKKALDAKDDRADPAQGFLNAGLAHAVGERALIGWALLECGVPADDPHIKKIARSVRDDAEQLRHTYSISLMIFFLDKLGDPADQPLIETLALRLVAGQTRTGAWSYNCPILTEAVQSKLAAFLRANARVVPGNYGGKPVGMKELPNETKNLPVVVWLNKGERALNQPAPPVGPFGLRGDFFAYDNSNTQFALMGLWVAKRSGAPVQPAMAFLERHFRRTQRKDGSWGYNGSIETSNGSMTAAGLMGLAIGQGTSLATSQGTKKPALDKAISMGFRYLAANLAREMQWGPQLRMGLPTGRVAPKPPPIVPDNYYLFWSIERVAVCYDIKVIAGREWYPWLSKRIVKTQRDGGGWTANLMGVRTGDGPMSVTYTAFALLVLRRVNVAPDLTVSIKKTVILPTKDLELNMTGSLLDESDKEAPKDAPKSEEPKEKPAEPKP